MGKNKFLAIITVFLALILFIIFRPGDDPILTFKIATIAASVVFVGVFLFDRYLWRIPPFCSLHNVIDISGDWAGKTENGEDGSFLELNLKIAQHFDDVKVKISGDTFVSESLICRLKREKNGSFLYVLYRSKPKQKLTSQEDITYGSMIVRCDPDVLICEYFTNNNIKHKIELFRS